MEKVINRHGHRYSLYWIYKLLVVKAFIAAIHATCTFPSDLVGQWIRGHDSKVLTFTSSGVSGLDIPYFATSVNVFTCNSKNDNKYIISGTYTSLTSNDRNYYACWYLQKVTGKAFILYELTSDLSETGFTPAKPGVTEANGVSVSESTVCALSVSTKLFTTLIKNDATPSDVATKCPSSLFATFSYNLCPDSELDFCSDRTTAKVNYTKCSNKILNTDGGVTSCMGHVDQTPYTYVNLFNHDPGNGVTCLWFSISNGLTGTAKYSTGDCTTATSSDLSLTLTPTATCPEGGDEGGGGEEEEEEGGASSATTGAIAGGAVGFVVVGCVVGAAVYYFVNKKGKASRVVHGDKISEMESNNALPDSPVVLSNAPVITTRNFPFPEPHDPTRKLPPIETRGSIDLAPGEPLRT